MTRSGMRPVRRLLPLLAVAVLAAGCDGGRHPVSGRVVYDDGSPLDEGTVIGETTDGGAKVTAQGTVGKDGAFTWGTGKAGNGARPGRYRVAVQPRALGDAETAAGARPAVDEKFGSFDTSGIEFEVKPGPNDLKITVTRPKPLPAPEPKPADPANAKPAEPKEPKPADPKPKDPK